MVCFNEKEFIYEKIDDSSAILKLESQDIFLLNITSDYIMNSLLEQKNIEEIIDESWKMNPDIKYDNIYKDFIHIKDILFEKGILYES